tara:strand:+ start:359 stop:1036 length:678 start_codon:yes stop_codon:yes gene_type:complete
MLKIGHRGAMGYEPENTLASFRKAVELKVDIAELDVYKCKTGELVVIHDDRVDRTTDGKGYVIEKTFEELRSLDAGKGEKIPTLREVLDLIDRKVRINIELKGTKTAKPVHELIKEYIKGKGWKEDDFLVSSFDHYELRDFIKLGSNIRIGALITGIPIGYSNFAKKVNAYSVNLSVEFVNQKFVDDAHKNGFKVMVWTVNDKEDIERVEQLGVDGIFSNFPDRI